MKNCPTCQTSYPNNFVVCPQDGATLVEVGAWTEGAVIRGKYRILSKVGQGGMGTVYKVVHTAFDEVHALKVINPSLMSDNLFVKRFKHEAVITRKLQHPNAVRVDDIDEAEDGRPIIVMEYIEGQSLKKLIQDQGALPVTRVCEIIKQAAAALEAAHALGMVHRDIKPDNIVLIPTPDGAEIAKVLDFGIAKLKEAQSSESGGMTLTGTGVVIGTPQYMSPEQAMGKRGDDLDGRSDLYSLGVVMYQMLTGDLPFHADTTMAMLLAHMQSPPVPIKSAHPELNIPDAVADVVMRTLEKDPDARPHDARALINEIEAAEQAGSSIAETRVVGPGQMYSPQDSARRLRDAMKTPTGVRTGTVRRPTPTPPPPPEPVYEEPVEAVAPQPQPEPEPPRLVTQKRATPSRVVAQPQPPQPRQVVVPQPARKSNAALWGVVAVLGVLLVAGGFYVFVKTSSPSGTGSGQVANGGGTDSGKTGNDATKTDANKTDGGQGNQGQTGKTGTEGTDQAKQADDSSKGTGGTSDNNGGTSTPTDNSNTTGRRGRGQNADHGKQTRTAVDPAKISGAIKLGDFYLQRGEYDNAINEYSKGLALDPGNATLRDKLARARKAKAAESRVLQ